MGYFAQVRGQGTVGSSTMPHKVNPIRFENAEANLEVSNALLDVLGGDARAVPAAARPHRLLHAAQHRHGVRPLLLALDNVARGLAGLDAVPAAMAADLEANWEVLGEPVQSAMRALGGAGRPGHGRPLRAAQGADPRAPDRPARTCAGSSAGSACPPRSRSALLALTPQTYVGAAPSLVDFLD